MKGVCDVSHNSILFITNLVSREYLMLIGSKILQYNKERQVFFVSLTPMHESKICKRYAKLTNNHLQTRQMVRWPWASPGKISLSFHARQR